MDDQNAGGDNPKRPGMNDSGGAVGTDGSSKNKSRKRRRPRRRKSPNGSGPIVQAEANSLKQGNATANPSEPKSTTSAEPTKSGAQTGPPLPSRSRRNKRARRRGKRPGDQQSPAPSANEALAVEHSPTDEQAKRPAGGATEKAGRHNGGRNRNRRAMPGGDQAKKDKRRENAGQGHNSGATEKPAHSPPAHHRPRPGYAGGDAYAALDLGTNNCRLLVAVPQQPGRFRVVDAFSRIVRLGEGLAASGRLSDAAMDRAVGALKACAAKLEGRQVRGVRLIATEACRRADNGADFLDRVEREAGLTLEIIDRETEAHLAVAGCSSLVDRRASGVVLFDIGGGSSELALLDLSKRKRHDLAPAVISWTSLPVGVVTLSEKHGGGRKVTRSVFDGMVAEVAQMLEGFEGRDSLKEAGERGEIHLLGTSGTVTTLAGIHLDLPRYDRRKVDGIWMNSANVTAMIDQLVDMSFEERVANPCIGHDRADLVLAGCAILVAIQQLWPCPRLRVADRGLREGLLTQMMNRDNAWQKRKPFRR